jgi:hypothetical protein
MDGKVSCIVWRSAIDWQYISQALINPYPANVEKRVSL